MRGMSVCLKCIRDKIEYAHTFESTDVYLPCLKYREELTNATSTKNMRELLCQVGPYQWCPRFCNMSDRRLEFRVSIELPVIIKRIKTNWFAEKV